MRFIVHTLLLLGLLVLGACSTATDAEDSVLENEEEIEERSIVADEITTTFYPEVTKLRKLTAEDHEWYDIIMSRLNATDNHTGDQETVYEIAEEYGEDPEELWFTWIEIVNIKWFGNTGDYVIFPEAYEKLTNEILDKNIIGENIEFISGGSDFDEENLTTSVHHELQVDGESHEITYVIEHREDYTIAEIIEFTVNGEKIDL